MSATETRRPAKPVLITETAAGTMTWERSMREQAARVEKDRVHGHKLPLKCGDEVRDPEGRKGILTHKEFLYENTPEGPGHDVWLLNVQYMAYVRTFSNPSALTLVRTREEVK